MGCEFESASGFLKITIFTSGQLHPLQYSFSSESGLCGFSRTVVVIEGKAKTRVCTDADESLARVSTPCFLII